MVEPLKSSNFVVNKTKNMFTMNLSETLRTNIIKCLNDKKMSRIELAVATQLHESVISRILSGKREINMYHLDQIARALGMDVTSLIHYPEQVMVICKNEKQIIINL
jgi:transcriptional regulator with XRE-family HTH domain